MKPTILVFIAALQLSAQTDIYLRASAPAPQTIIGASNATPIVVQTYSAHGFSNSCNLTTNLCYCGGSDLATGTGLSPANRPMLCTVNDSTHLNLYDLSGNPIAGNGAWWNGWSNYLNSVGSAQWIGLLTKFTLPANPGPLGFLDGTTGDLVRRLKGDAYNGTTGLSVAGCPSACVITWTVSYSFSSSKFPMAAGNHFSISGTGTALYTCGDATTASGENSPYTAASVIGGIVTSNAFTCSISNGNYLTINPHCGPAGTPNDTIGGSLNCSTVSQMAWVGNPTWDWMLAKMAQNNIDCTPIPSCRSTYTNYKTTYDGGVVTPGPGIHSLAAMAAVRFLIDPSQGLWLNESIYYLNHDFRISGTGYTFNTAANTPQSNSDYVYTIDEEGLSIEYGAAAPYWTASEKAAFITRTYSDLDDPVAGQCTSINMDAANKSTHNWVLSTGNLAAGTNDSTHFTIPNTDPHYGSSNYCVGTVVTLYNGGSNTWESFSTGLITAYNSSTGVATVSGGFSGAPPALNNVIDATYSGGLSCPNATTGQTVMVNLGGGGGVATIPIVSTGTLGAAMTILFPGSGYGSAPTSGGIYGGAGNAACTGTATFTSHLGTTYAIYDTFTISSRANGGTATATFTKTNNLNSGTTPPVHVGDMLMAANWWGSNFTVGEYSSYITAVGTNTLTVINNNNVTASTTTPEIAWRLPQWTSGDCGRIVPQKNYGVTGMLYGASAGNSGGVGTYADAAHHVIADAALNGGGQDLDAWLALDLAIVGESGDARAVRDLIRQMYMVDFGVRPYMDFSTGRGRDGAGYTIDEDVPVADRIMWTLTQSVPTYPKLDIDTGPWGTATALWQIFSLLPDLNGGDGWYTGWAGSGFQLYDIAPQGATSVGLALNPVFSFAGNSALAGYFRYWQEHVLPSSPFGSIWGKNQANRQALTFLHNDPRIPSTSYTGMPHQYAFTKSSSAAMTADLGWPSIYRGDSIISRSGWTSTNDALALFDFATYTGNGAIYDTPRVGQFSLWNTGALIGSDNNPANQQWNSDPSVLSDTIGFGIGGQFNSGVPPTVGLTPITLWAGDTAGSFGAQYGDSSSRFAAACGNALPNYNQSSLGLSLSEVFRCFVDLKNAGDDHFFATFDEVALASGSASITWHLHYPQNGQTQSGGWTGSNPTGTTTCTGAGGCAAVNTNGRIIKSLQDGGGSSPARTHGLLSYISSPGTIYVADNCVGHGGGQCAPGDTYSGGNGYTHRFEIGGGASAGAHVSGLTSVVGHKLMANLADTAFSTADLNPDANWTGVQLTGATSSGVMLFGRGGTHSILTTFTANSTLPVDWTFVGVAPGTYAVTVGGIPVSGSPFTVSAGSNTIFFHTGTGGSVSLGTTIGAPTAIAGNVTASGNAVIH